MTENGDQGTIEIGEQVQTILIAAETAAREIASAAERRAQESAAATISQARADAERLRAQAAHDLQEYLAARQREIQAHATARIDRITELTGGLIAAADSIQERLEQAGAMQAQVRALIEALVQSAEAVAREAAQPPPPVADAAAVGAQIGDDV